MISLLRHIKSIEIAVSILTYAVLTTYFLIGVLTSSGSLAQQNWNLPLTLPAAHYWLENSIHAWIFYGFGQPNNYALGVYGLPWVQSITYALAYLGVTGGAMVKFWAFVSVFLSGVFAWILARDLKLSAPASFVGGLAYMTTPVLFDRLMGGGIGYLFDYFLLPLYTLFAYRAVSARSSRRLIYYSLAEGLLLNLLVPNPSVLLAYIPLNFLVLALAREVDWRRRLINWIVQILVLIGTLIPFVFINLYLLNITHLNIVATAHYFASGGVNALWWQYVFSNSFANVIRLWGSAFGFQFEASYPQNLLFASFFGVFFAGLSPFLARGNAKRVALAFLGLFATLVGAIYFIHENFYFATSIPVLGAMLLNLIELFFAASLGLSMALAATTEGLLYRARRSRKKLRSFAYISVILLVVVSAGLPWFSLQVSGNPSANALAKNMFPSWIALPGPITKLNLAQVPSGYYSWQKAVKAQPEYFVLYWPPLNPGVGHIRFNCDPLFNGSFKGVCILDGPVNVFNGLPSVISPFPAPLSNVIGNLTAGQQADYAQILGNLGIKYIVIYENTSVSSGQNWSTLYSALKGQPGFVKVNVPGVIVFVNTQAKPILHAEGDDANVSDVRINYDVFSADVSAKGPFLLVLDQAYDPSFRLNVNGSEIPASAHVKVDRYFNGWSLNGTGTYHVLITYAGDTDFLALQLAYVAFMISILVYLLMDAWLMFRRNSVKDSHPTNDPNFKNKDEH